MPFRKITCPHCIRDVSINTDAICPACGANTTLSSPETEGLTLVEFVDGEKLPPVCVLCGDPVSQFVEVGEKNETDRPDAWFSLSRLLGALAGVFAIKVGPDQPTKEWRISVRLPVCDRHRESRYLNPAYVDYERYRLTIPAHRAFIEHWKRWVR